MPVTLYLKASGHPALRLCDPLAPCPPLGGYDPALMDWVSIAPGLFDEDAAPAQAIGWMDDGGIFDVVVPPVALPPRGDDAFRSAGARDRFWRKKADEWLEEQLEAVKESRKHREPVRIEPTPDFVSDIPELTPHVSALEGLAARVSGRAPNDVITADIAAWIMAEEKAAARRRRARRDMEAILVLAA